MCSRTSPPTPPTSPGFTGNGTYTARTFPCKLNSIGYQVRRFMMRGHAAFVGQSLVVPIVGEIQSPDDPAAIPPDRPPVPGDRPGPTQINQIDVTLAGDPMMSLVDNRRLSFVFTPGQDITDFQVNGRRLMTEDVNLMLGFWDVGAFALSFRVELQLTPQ